MEWPSLKKQSDYISINEPILNYLCENKIKKNSLIELSGQPNTCKTSYMYYLMGIISQTENVNYLSFDAIDTNYMSLMGVNLNNTYILQQKEDNDVKEALQQSNHKYLFIDNITHKNEEIAEYLFLNNKFDLLVYSSQIRHNIGKGYHRAIGKMLSFDTDYVLYFSSDASTIERKTIKIHVLKNANSINKLSAVVDYNIGKGFNINKFLKKLEKSSL